VRDGREVSALTPPVRQLLRLSEELQRQPTLDGVLQRLVDGAAALLTIDHVSIRLLDASRTLLLTSARAGDPFHQNKTFEFVMGEGLVGWVAKNGQTLRLANAEADARFRPRPDQTKPIRSFIAVPLLEQNVCIGVISAASEEADRFTEDHEELLGLVAGVCGPHVRHVRLCRMVAPDPLTGVLDPKALDEAYPDVDGIALADPLSVLMAEVDGFERIRERFGRGFGDDLLKSVAEGIANGVRRSDPVIRRGSHAFLTLLPGVTLATTAKIAERIRRMVEADLILSRPDASKLTVSIGIAERQPDERRDALLARATRALESAKKRGNKVEFA
jgi:diguanylate cyclase (GGDEF)-like protein